MNLNLTARTAVVTGASRGIGRAIALRLAEVRGELSADRRRELVSQVKRLPHAIAEILEGGSEDIDRVAERFKDAQFFLYLGLNAGRPVFLEGALKLKEISYVHAEGYPAGEMKHGPIALIDENVPVVALCLRTATYDKMLGNAQEVKARDGRLVAVVTEGDDRVSRLADHVIEVPAVDELLSPIVASVPLQLLAYHVGVRRGCDVDQPRNLAKSVTVE